jgi:hypothetical protein
MNMRPLLLLPNQRFDAIVWGAAFWIWIASQNDTSLLYDVKGFWVKCGRVVTKTDVLIRILIDI